MGRILDAEALKVARELDAKVEALFAAIASVT